MRLLLLIAAFGAVGSARPALAQRATAPGPTASSAQNRIALAGRPEATAAKPMRLACAPLVGQVFEPNGKPLVGATLLVKGTHQVYVTDSEGKFQFTETIYQGQELTVGAAGYIPHDIALDDCTLPRLVLEKDPTAHIKRTGKRAGQVIRLNNHNTNLK
ncbi:carboxypeptidase-like regulatory domain-containing protein [Hymenobacter terricola]|uniref:carboxypeptidase-like regulatory domain-containing protein n=1 Tax=Hymenobacter terricola TaxID=2819236 RepID=UPI001B30D565|nr:carboxypeptidase-like regulatory domain-containing protein [Hymenobacter terricola]